MSNAAIDFTETQYKAIPGQISTNDSKGIVECFVAAIGNKDSVGDICLPGCFNGSLSRRKPRVVWGHNWNEPIGKVLEIYEVGPNDPRLPVKMRTNGVGGLFAKVQFNLASEKGREAFANVKFFGEEQEWSIGYKTLDAVFDAQKQANMLKEVELYEVSPVLHGANQLTGTISIKSDKLNDSNTETKNQQGPCWPGYKQVGMKKGKGGKMVPNCVPIDGKSEEEQEDEKSALRDPKGGLTAAGRAHFKRTEGANLKPGVKGPANTPEKMRRKGSFLTRFFTNPSGPMKDDKGRPTRLALSAAAWGEPVPQDRSDAAKLAAKGRRLLERYENSKKKSDDDVVEQKNIQIYSIINPSENPVIGRMGNLAKAISTHFGGEVAVREADSNNVVFDLSKDGRVETMRATYHTPNESDFMFGPAQQVRVETIYLPIDSNGQVSGSPVPRSPNMLAMPKTNDCGCGGACGGKSSPFSSWQEFKAENPGVHLFIKTENMEMFEVANQVSEYHGFDVELLSDGFVIPNIDWYEKDARDAVITAVEGVEQKAFARIGRSARAIGRRAARMVKPSEFDGDGDGFRTGRDGRDNVPYKPDIDNLKPRMMPPRRVPKEVPQKEPQPLRIPKPHEVPRPAPRPAPVPDPRPAPSPTPEPAVPEREPAKPGAISGRMTSKKQKRAKDLKAGKFDAEIYKRRMAGSSLEQEARRYGVQRIDIRRAEQRHMQKLRATKKPGRPSPELSETLGNTGNVVNSPGRGRGGPRGDGPTISGQMARRPSRPDSFSPRPSKLESLFRQGRESLEARKRKGKVSKRQAMRDLKLARELDAARYDNERYIYQQLQARGMESPAVQAAAKKFNDDIVSVINQLLEPAESVTGPLASRKTRRQSMLRQLREIEMDPSNLSGVPQRAKERAVAMIAKRNNLTESQVRRALRRELAAERMVRAAQMMKNRRKSLSSVYVSVSEGNDIAVKTALQSTIDEPVFIKIEPQFVTQVKQVVDTVANFHGIRITQAENGLNVFGAHELNDDSIEAISRAIYATYLDTNIEEVELDRIFPQG